MLSRIPAEQIYRGDYGWHVGRFHFAFADYVDPENISFGDLITFNDFTLQPSCGFEPHSHQEIEIVSYCVEGELVHEDSMGNKEIIKRGEMQYTCAGSGITHSEKNASPDRPLRFIQIWIRPHAASLSPSYRSIHLERRERLNTLLQIASGKPLGNGTRINQDADIYVAELEAGRQMDIKQQRGRQIYLVCLEGMLSVNNVFLKAGDAIKIRNELLLALLAVKDSHLLSIDMPGSL
jgi:quercetin 2,3-dioxygenase